MGSEAPWIVGALIAVVIAFIGPAGVLVARIQRHTTVSGQKLTATDQALNGFRDLVQDLQEERDALKREKDEWRVERITMTHEMADLKREVAALTRRERENGG